MTDAKKVISLDKARTARDANRHRLLIAEALLELFRRANGRDATTTAELGQWVADAGAAVPKPIRLRTRCSRPSRLLGHWVKRTPREDGYKRRRNWVLVAAPLSPERDGETTTYGTDWTCRFHGGSVASQALEIKGPKTTVGCCDRRRGTTRPGALSTT